MGDLNEYFERNVRSKGLRRAKLIYIIDAFKFCRTYTVRRPKFVNLFINWIMIGSYIKTSARNLMRNKLFSFINIVGLAISMSVGLLLIAFVLDLRSYDRFHQNGERQKQQAQRADSMQDQREDTRKEAQAFRKRLAADRSGIGRDLEHLAQTPLKSLIFRALDPSS